MNIFEKFNKNADLAGLKNDIQEAKNGGGTGEFKEVPTGTYEVEIAKLELKESKKGDPMVACWFKILEGEYKGSMLFMNQVITQGFQINIVNEFLRSLGTGINVEFEDYEQYNNLLMDILEDIEGNFEYCLKYSLSKKGFAEYKITEVYEVE